MATQPSSIQTNDADWWRRAVVYQIYPKSFADGNGDGIGDLPGAISRLDYLRALGIDAVWFSPIFPSPQCDGGYDVSDYRDIDPMFGSITDAETLIREAHARQIRVILDIVPNHTSSKHRFFQEALSTLPGSPAWARYHCVRGRGEKGELPPNNWQSIFGGLAWTPLLASPDGKSTIVGDASATAGTPTGWWFLHLFDTHQPDVNWDHPDIVREFDDTLRFWFDRGVDGIRIDVAQGMIKQRGYPDVLDSKDPALLDPHAKPYFDQPEVHEVYRRWRKIADSYDPPRVFVAEAWLDTPEKRARYLRADELHTGFNFDLLTAEWDGNKWRDIIDSSMAADALVGAPTTWVTENHDVRRSPTRYGGRVGRSALSPNQLGVVTPAETTPWYPVERSHHLPHSMSTTLFLRRARSAWRSCLQRTRHSANQRPRVETRQHRQRTSHVPTRNCPAEVQAACVAQPSPHERGSVSNLGHPLAPRR
ncbi:MAG: alpha-amylase [Actinobacteria bacterium]|nr:alpha-amylase [Actinomycetota bacterium]